MLEFFLDEYSKETLRCDWRKCLIRDLCVLGDTVDVSGAISSINLKSVEVHVSGLVVHKMACKGPKINMIQSGCS